MSSLLLANCQLIATVDDRERELADASIVIDNGWITRVGDVPEHRVFDETVDCAHFLAVPGLVNAHHHLYQTLTRGFSQSSGRKLFDWLELLYPIWAGLDRDMIYQSTRAGLAELALSGCTTSADHLYVFPPHSEYFLDAQIAGATEIGMRFHPTRGSMDLGRSDGGLPPDSVVQDRREILRDSERVIAAYHDSAPGSMIRVGLAPCSPFSATPELMLESAGLARDERVRLHTHIAETLDEEDYSRSKFGVSPVQLLDRLGWISEDVWLAHCVHTSPVDITLLAERRASAAHCPTSNMLLGSGMAPVRDMLRAGVQVGIGVDGSASNDSNDLRQEMKQAVLSARARDGVEALSVRQALRMATRGGAQCLGRDDIGSIEPGKAGDIALLDVSGLECAGGQEDLVGAAILGSPRVDTVIVHGKIVIRGGELRTADAMELAARQNEASKRLMSKWRAAA